MIFNLRAPLLCRLLGQLGSSQRQEVYLKVVAGCNGLTPDTLCQIDLNYSSFVRERTPATLVD